MFSLYNPGRRLWKQWQSLAGECKRMLAEREAAPGTAGTILKDVEVLIEFIGPEGIVTKGKNGNLPIHRLPELNLKSSHPLQLKMKRPLLRDYPNLAGTFILLRVMDLLQVKGSRIVVCP